jgi:hypothetical protein
MAYWRSRIGQLEVSGPGEKDEAQMSRDVYLRCLMVISTAFKPTQMAT